MWRRIGQIIGGTVLALTTLAALFLVSMRAKYPPVLTAVRRMNRAFWNPRAMKTAGQPGAMASVIRHVGRTSGTPYETPIGPFATDDGFVVALPYGSTPDWLKNLMAAGSAVIVHEGNTYRVDRPELIPSTVAFVHVPPSEQWSLRLFGVDQFLRVRCLEAQGMPGETAEPV
ncbi:MAG: nitroreductase family deazaflavin-dependent oxidoreductase [Actinomycetota bacterium]|nr:nitroreductase family deazaflavin-dependent oxidoreductase [Actinomycetota bacterium]